MQLHHESWFYSKASDPHFSLWLCNSVKKVKKHKLSTDLVRPADLNVLRMFPRYIQFRRQQESLLQFSGTVGLSD